MCWVGQGDSLRSCLLGTYLNNSGNRCRSVPGRNVWDWQELKDLACTEPTGSFFSSMRKRNMVSMPRGLSLEPHILTAHGNPSCEHTYGQAISGKKSACGSRAESWKRLFLWLVDGFNPSVGWLEHLECCGLCSHGVIPNSGVGAETQVTQSSVPGRRQQEIGRRTVRMEQSIHWFLCVIYCCFGTLQAGNHVCLILHCGIFLPDKSSESTAYCGCMF